MPETLKISFQNDVAAIARLKAKGPRIIEIIMSKMNKLMFMLTSFIVASELSGQVLQRRTGILSGSVRVIPAALEGTNIIGGVSAGGGASFYGKLFESVEAGGTGGVPHPWMITATKARALAFLVDGKQVFAKRVMHPGLAARPFMKPALDSHAANIKSELQQSVQDGLDE